MRRMGCVVLCAALTACGSSSTGSRNGSGSGSDAVDCRQKDDADTTNDCDGHAGTPRKLDCDTSAAQKTALDAGCVAEKAGSLDVCCPKTVSGQVETRIACSEPADTLTDSDCEGTDHPRKLDCSSAETQQAGFSAGCVAENPGDAADFDVCCALSVRGGG